MTLPANFDTVEHFLDGLRKIHNLWVRAEFDDAVDDDISLPRSSLKKMCLMEDNDSAIMAILRILFFFFYIRKFRDFQVSIYGSPLQQIQATRKYKPQITLVFKESEEDASLDDRQPWYGEISFRLMDKDSESITRSEIGVLVNRIDTLMGAGNGLEWRKGKAMATYTEVDRGYALQILCRDKEHAKFIIGKVLDIQNHTPNWKYLNFKENDDPNDAFPQTPPTIRILGKTEREPLRRPNVNVRYRYTEVHLWGRGRPMRIHSLDTVDALDI